MMGSGRYQKFREHELILRDQLAIDRTKLSNDRTLMAFARTALTLFIAGVTALHFLVGEDIWWRTLAWVFTLGGPIVFLLGVKRYGAMLRDIARGKEQLVQEK